MNIIYINFQLIFYSHFVRNRNEGTFEVVSHSKSSSYRHVEQSKLAAGQGPKLTLGNRYNTLSNDS